MNDDIGGSQFVGLAVLRGDALLCRRFCHAPPLDQARKLAVWRRIHHPDRIDSLAQTAFQQLDGFDDDHIGFGSAHQGVNAHTHRRMGDGFQLAQGSGLGEDDLAQSGTVDFAIRVQQ